MAIGLEKASECLNVPKCVIGERCVASVFLNWCQQHVRKPKLSSFVCSAVTAALGVTLTRAFTAICASTTSCHTFEHGHCQNVSL